MPEKVTGYLSTDGTFFNDEDLCRHHDAKLALAKALTTGLKQDVSALDLFDIIHLYPELIYEYITARLIVLEKEQQQEASQHEPDTRPIEVEK